MQWELRRLSEWLVVGFGFLAVAVTWMGVLPLWQGPDEPAHFAYVQYMAVHRRAPVQKVVPAGKAPWVFSPSWAESTAIVLGQRNRVLANPQKPLTLTPAGVTRARRIIQSQVSPAFNRPGSQNYVGIYPPTYYAATATIEKWAGIRGVLRQAYGARLVTALLFVALGVLIHAIVRRRIGSRRLRVATTLALGLIFPTLGMLGGVVSNDMLVDAVSLLVFWLTIKVREAKSLSFRRAVAVGIVAGAAIWTKEEAYLGLAASFPFVLASVLRCGWRKAAKWMLIASAVFVAIAGPWLLFTWRAYHAIVPPMTYQGAANAPRTLTSVMQSELLNLGYLKDLFLNQTLLGINYPWWYPLPHHQWLVRGVGLFIGAMLLTGLIAGFRDLGWPVTITWAVVGWVGLWTIEVLYRKMTGASFLQGRYFFYLMGPFAWAWTEAARKGGRGLAIAGLLTATMMSLVAWNATMERYYHLGLGAFVRGQVAILAPPSVVVASRLALVTFIALLAAVLVILGLPHAGRQETTQ